MEAILHVQQYKYLNFHQYNILETAFAKNLYPNKTTTEQLASQLNMSEKQVGIWFKNRRRKLKREKSSQSATKSELNINASICTSV